MVSDEDLLLLVVVSSWLWLWKGWKAIDQASCWNEMAATWNEMAATFFDDDVMMMVVGSREEEEAEGTAVPFLLICAAGRSEATQWSQAGGACVMYECVVAVAVGKF